jgi:hypothetical protein
MQNIRLAVRLFCLPLATLGMDMRTGTDLGVLSLDLVSHRVAVTLRRCEKCFRVDAFRCVNTLGRVCPIVARAVG